MSSMFCCCAVGGSGAEQEIITGPSTDVQQATTIAIPLDESQGEDVFEGEVNGEVNRGVGSLDDGADVLVTGASQSSFASMPAPNPKDKATDSTWIESAEVWEWMWSNEKFANHQTLGVEPGGGKNAVIIKAVYDEGLASDWNRKNKNKPGNHEIVEGTAIVSVNNFKNQGSPEGKNMIMKALRSTNSLDILLRYVPTFTLCARNFKELGITFNDGAEEKGEVEWVHYKGVIPEHNRRCDAGYEITKGDVIRDVKKSEIQHQDQQTSDAGQKQTSTLWTVTIERTAHLREADGSNGEEGAGA